MSQQTSKRSNFGLFERLERRGLATAGIRVGVAVVLWLHALARFGVGPRASGVTVGDFGAWLGMAGLPAPHLLAWTVTLVEVVGGLFLVVGLLVRVAAALIAIDIAVAFAMVHLPAGFAEQAWQIELTGLLVLLAVSLVISGPGTLSLDRKLFGEEGAVEEWLVDRFRS